MTGQQLVVESSGGSDARKILNSGVRGDPDVSAMASLDKQKLSVLVWHYHDDDVSGPEAAVELNLTNLPLANGDAKLTQYRIDADHSNSYEAWKRMGSPQQPSAEQYKELEKAGQLAQLGEPETVHIENGQAVVQLKLPRQAVSLCLFQWQ